VRRAFVAVTLPAVLFTLRTAEAQQSHDPVAEERLSALNTAFRFITDLSDSNVVIAKCRIPEIAKDASLAALLDDRFRARFVGPATTDTNITRGCGVAGFAVKGARVYWVESFVEITRGGELLPMNRKQYEITFQVLMGPEYREYRRYLVGPSGIVSADSTFSGAWRYKGWRVVEYKLLGADYDWGVDLGGSASFRRPLR
jgi:hypothetical protein